MVLWLVTLTDLLNVSRGFVSISWASCWIHLQYWLLCEYFSFTIVIKDIVVINTGDSDFHICLPISVSLFICIILLCLYHVRADIKRLCASDVWQRLSVAYIRPKSRTERARKTKIGTEVAHVTPLSRSKVNLQGAEAYCVVSNFRMLVFRYNWVPCSFMVKVT